ncbi:ABC transporter substrate-binding protein [Proteiniclasticum ruminis]|uniref:ABC-type branched-chain amino acid transport system, substrate-binding protein n=1 Tax=Proteiniclasticum ruminis TaxID=398199 RepID=A0A1G8MAC0_9CLOT|nr:ABC transporter substrate-binding protein [Proteiniclasticum ruminis]SDI64310.1 ABC-type branched-chain amino acid transport system, substrate-binding protein [Proteiniclasticum ruminis]
MKKIIAMLASLAIVASFAACGAKEETPETPGTPGTETPVEKPEDEEPAQGVFDDKIIVGNSAATSGNYAPVGVPFNAGIEAYFKMINEAGGVNGRKIEFKHIDDEFDPVKGKAALSTLVEDEKIFALVGHFGTPVVGATIEDVKEYGIPAVYFATGIGQLYNDKAEGKDRGIFPVQPIYQTEGQIMVARAVGDFEAKKIGVIYTNDDAGKDLFAGVEAKAKELGVEIVAEQVAAGATDVSSAVTSIKNANVDFVIGAAIQATIPTIVKELAAQNVNKDLITTYVNVSPVISEAVINEINGKFDVYGLGWVDLVANADSLAAFAEWAPDYATNVYAMTGWIAGHFFVEGLKRVEGTVTWDKYMDALESAPIKNPFGGEINYAGGLRAGTQEMNLSKVGLVENAPGWVPVDGLQSMDSLLGK